jgi:outer membrane protein
MNFAKLSAVSLLLTISVFSGFSQAIEKGDWIVRGGYTNINPTSNNGEVVNLGDQSNLTATFAYLVTDNVGLEVLAGLPFEHNIFDKALGTGLKIGSGKHLPPTVTLQYYFNANSNVRPYLGIGINHTFFFKEKTTGPLSGASLDIGSSTDLAIQFGVDWNFNENLILNLDLRKFNIESTATVTNIGNSSLGEILPSTLSFKVPIDPLTIGLSLAWVF